jgi:hypothetical protein
MTLLTSTAATNTTGSSRQASLVREMRRRALHLTVIVSAVVVLVACGGTVPSADGNGIFIHASERVTYQTLDDMAQAADIIVFGVVADVTLGRVSPAPELEDFDGTQFLEVTITPDEVLAGTVSAPLVVEWLGWEIEEGGEPGAPFLVEGIPVPREGDRAIWFLMHRRDAPEASGATVALASYDGRLDLTDELVVVARISDQSRLSHTLAGRTLDEIRDDIQSALGDG